MKEEKKRCGWTKGNALNNHYHDTEWGVPVHDDKKLFEFLILDAFQAGLSWLTILKKRENFRKAFDDFDYIKISRYDEKKVDELMQNKGIIRNRRKIEAAISNAIAFMKIQKEYGSFDKYIWQFVDYKIIINKNETWEQTPTTSKESDLMSKDLRRRGFKFVGSTICYAFMQAAGMINDHEETCFRYKEVQKYY